MVVAKGKEELAEQASNLNEALDKLFRALDGSLGHGWEEGQGWDEMSNTLKRKEALQFERLTATFTDMQGDEWEKCFDLLPDFQEKLEQHINDAEKKKERLREEHGTNFGGRIKDLEVFDILWEIAEQKEILEDVINPIINPHNWDRSQIWFLAHMQTKLFERIEKVLKRTCDNS